MVSLSNIRVFVADGPCCGCLLHDRGPSAASAACRTRALDNVFADFGRWLALRDACTPASSTELQSGCTAPASRACRAAWPSSSSAAQYRMAPLGTLVPPEAGLVLTLSASASPAWSPQGRGTGAASPGDDNETAWEGGPICRPTAPMSHSPSCCFHLESCAIPDPDASWPNLIAGIGCGGLVHAVWTLRAGSVDTALGSR